MLYTTNKLLGKYQGLDGLKTGYTQRAGSCLVATALRHDMRLISVILGARSEKIRDRETRRLLSWGFNTFSRVPIVKTGEPMGKVALDWGLEPEVRALTSEALVKILSPEQVKTLGRRLELPSEIPAPGEKPTERRLFWVQLRLRVGSSSAPAFPRSRASHQSFPVEGPTARALKRRREPHGGAAAPDAEKCW